MQQTVKQQALEAISKLPDDAKMDDIMYRLYVLDQIKKGMDDIDAGRVISQADLEKEIAKW